LVGGPPGVELHTVLEELPSGAVGEMFPIVVMAIGVGMDPSAAVGAIAAGGIVGASAVVVAPGMEVEGVLITISGAGTGTGAKEGDGSGGTVGGGGAGMVEPGRSLMNDVAGSDASGTNGAAVLSAAIVEGLGATVGIVGANIDDAAPVVPAIGDTEVTCTVGVPGVICPTGVAQVTTVPGIVGSEASGNGASVVSGAAWVSAENGLGPLSGEDWIAPGVDGRPMAVVPMVDTCPRQAWTPDSRATVVISKRRIANSFPVRI
jgi:hypothetical protein